MNTSLDQLHMSLAFICHFLWGIVPYILKFCIINLVVSANTLDYLLFLGEELSSHKHNISVILNHS